MPRFMHMVWPNFYYWLQTRFGGEPPESFWMICTMAMY